MSKNKKKLCSKEVKDICPCNARKYETFIEKFVQTQVKQVPVQKKQSKKKPKKPKKQECEPIWPHCTPCTCVCPPMTPSLTTRLKYMQHCPPYPLKYRRMKETVCPPKRRDSNVEFKEEYSLCPDIMLPTPVPGVVHTHSDGSILNVPSPKTSGENIQALRTSLQPDMDLPPLPPESVYELNKPHSGIYINEEVGFIPNQMDFPCQKLPIRISHKKRRNKIPNIRQHKKDVQGMCNAKCKSKRCRKLDAKRKRQLRNMKLKRLIEEGTCGITETRKEQINYPANIKPGAFKTHSLTIVPCKDDKKPYLHYGILTGTFNMYDTRFGNKSRGKQAMTMSIMAYCLAFHYHPKQWTTKLVDNLITAGDEWYMECLAKVHDHTSVQGICEVVPFAKKQKVYLNGKVMLVYLGEPEIIGYTMSSDPTIYNLCRGLKVFFQENRAGVLMTRILKVAIWRDRVCYYIFDPAGRDYHAYSNYTHGGAALINLQDLEAVAENILARTTVEDQKYVLAPVKVLKMLDEDDDEDIESDPELTQAEKAKLSYRIMNESCAIINADMHLGDRSFEGAKYRQALPIAVMAMTYAKISPPNTWYTKTLNKILRLGNKLYLECSHPKLLSDLTIDNIPNRFNMGPYTCEIIIYADKVNGQLFTPKECYMNIRRGLEEFFNQGYNCGIIEFNTYTLPIWKQKEMYYIFDPYPRTADGNRSIKGGSACVFMMINLDSVITILTNNWRYLPNTTEFQIHGFKVLRLRKKISKKKLVCTLSKESIKKPKKIKREILEECLERGDNRELFHDVMPAKDVQSDTEDIKIRTIADEEKMGDIVSLVDSIQEGFVPPIPKRYKNLPPEEEIQKMVNLDSPTVSLTQVVPPWPKPRDKSNEVPDPDPDPEPTPPPTPPPADDEDADEEESDDEKEKKPKKIEIVEIIEELPPALPPPPPSPQIEVELASVDFMEPTMFKEQELEILEPVEVSRHVLVAKDTSQRSKLISMRKKITPPLDEKLRVKLTPSQEFNELSDFKTLPDYTQIINGTSFIANDEAQSVMPFAAIMAIVTSYKYMINTWTKGIINFVIDSAKKLHDNKCNKFQFAPVHIIPKISIGHQTYHATIDVHTDGPTWTLEDTLRKFFTKHDRGIVTTCNYSCAVFCRNGVYYLYDASPCNNLGLRNDCDEGAACFMRFLKLNDLITRILYNKDGKQADQQFILSRIIVKQLLVEPRRQLPVDYDYETGKPREVKSQTVFVKDKRSKVPEKLMKREIPTGYQKTETEEYMILGTTGLSDLKPSRELKPCHFVGVITMLLATMYPVDQWDQVMVDTCIEKGLEIYEKANSLEYCERRVIKNIILDGKFINLNIKKILVINNNEVRTLEQYINAVMGRLRYVMITFPQCSFVICCKNGFYHLFNPYPPPDPPENSKVETKTSTSSVTTESGEKVKKKPSKVSIKEDNPPLVIPHAQWSSHRNVDSLVSMITRVVNMDPIDCPTFYTFEVTSIKNAPKYSALSCKLSPTFKPDPNPNEPFLKKRKKRPLIHEKMYWLQEEVIWSRMNASNSIGQRRRSPKAVWNDWDIEVPGELFSLWGSLHPLDSKFIETNRGKQYLATSVLALAMASVFDLSAWTGSLIDGIVEAGDKYHTECTQKIGKVANVELKLEDLPESFHGLYPFSFKFRFTNIILGFVYNKLPDRFNLSNALMYFFELRHFGILISSTKNLAFGKVGGSYFMFDCQSYGMPLFVPGQGSAYVLKCESLNMLVYCMAMALNIKRHGQIFHLYEVDIESLKTSKEK